MLIGELARRAVTTPRLLRYYEQQGLLESERTANGYRRFEESDVLRAQQVRALLVAGFGTTTIAALLPCASGPRPEITMCPEVEREMRRVLERTDEELAELSRRRSAVAGMLGSAAPG